MDVGVSMTAHPPPSAAGPGTALGAGGAEGSRTPGPETRKSKKQSLRQEGEGRSALVDRAPGRARADRRSDVDDHGATVVPERLRDCGRCAFVLLATRLTQFGFNAAVVRLKAMRADHTATVFVVNLVLGMVTFVTLNLRAPFMGTFLRSGEAGHLLQLAALFFVITPFGTVPAALIERSMQFRHGTIRTGSIPSSALWYPCSWRSGVSVSGASSTATSRGLGAGGPESLISPAGHRRFVARVPRCENCFRSVLVFRRNGCSNSRPTTSTT